MNPTPISLLPRVSWRKAAAITGVGVVAVVSIVIALAFWLSRKPPTWWSDRSLDTPAMHQAAVDLENGLTTLLSRGGPGRPATTPGLRTATATATEPATAAARESIAPLATPVPSLNTPQRWRMGIKAEDANAWLNLRLPKWLANQDESFTWPEEVRELQVDFRDQRLFVGARLVGGGRERVVSAQIAPEFHADGSLWMPAEWVMIGKLGVPASWLLSGEGDTLQDVQEEVPDDLRELPQTQGVLGAFAGRHAVMTNPVVRLGDGRRVRLLSLEAKDGTLIIECQTETK